MVVWEEEFLLLYHMGKLTLHDIESMHVAKRKWFLERLGKERKKEADAHKKAAMSRGPAKATRPHRRIHR